MTFALPIAQRSTPMSSRSVLRWCSAMLLLGALAFGIWLQRTTITDAIGELRSMSLLALAALVSLAVFERWIRADIVRILMNGDGPGRGATMSLGTAVTVHDVGTAASKALPLGGAAGTAMRWSIARESDVTAPRFASVFASYGFASTLVAWMLPLVFLVVDVGRSSGDRNDWLLIAGISVVLGLSLALCGAVLRSDRLENWLSDRLGALVTRLRRRRMSAYTSDAASSATMVHIVRTELRRFARQPWPVMIRTIAAQCSGALILLISLRSLGVGSELGAVEFARVYFVTLLVGSFVPTPGGVGFVEAGMTGALIAAGVDVRLSLAAVLVYRLVTYVLPIVVGFVLYLRWRIAAPSGQHADDSELVEIHALTPPRPLAVAS